MPLAVHPLAGGGHNDVRRVDTTAGRFVVRRHLPPLPRAGADSRFELECQILASRHGLAPRVISAAADASWMVMELAPGNAWQEHELASVSGARRIGARLAQVHGLKAHPDMQSMDGAAIARQQLARDLNDRKVRWVRQPSWHTAPASWRTSFEPAAHLCASTMATSSIQTSSAPFRS